MPIQRAFSPRSRPSLSLVLLGPWLIALWIAGGASRADVPGQAVTRAMAWLVLVIAILFGKGRFRRSALPAAIIFLAAVVLVLAQLVPLPPPLWMKLPGRDLLAQAAIVTGQVQPWRPWTVNPSGTLNAASSMIAPAVTMFLAARLDGVEHRRVAALILCLVVGAMVLGLLQFSGAGFRNVLLNGGVTEVGGSFANRNHLALFLAIGILLIPAWAFSESRDLRGRGLIGLVLIVLFMLTILASGSRAGLVLGILSIGIAVASAWGIVRNHLRRAPRWTLPLLLLAALALVSAAIAAALAAGRAESIYRVLANDPTQDMRSRALPTILKMVRYYFPMGTGFGTFDRTFRIHEPFDLLDVSFFNHAHDDFLEIALDGGLFGALLLLAALGWWLRASFRAWRAEAGPPTTLPRLGSATLLLIFIASVFDYPARTPMIMSIAALAAIWLGRERTTALPSDGRHL